MPAYGRVERAAVDANFNADLYVNEQLSFILVLLKKKKKSATMSDFLISKVSNVSKFWSILIIKKVTVTFTFNYILITKLPLKVSKKNITFLGCYHRYSSM